MPTEKIEGPILAQFDRLVKNYKIFTLAFLGALFTESILLIFFFPFLVKSAFFSITLAALLITLFSFYTLRNYQFAEKEEALKELMQKYLKGILSLTQGQKTPKEVKQISAEACLELAEILGQRKGSLSMDVPSFFKPLSERLIRLLGREDAEQFQEILYNKALEEFSGQVRLSPCDITAHARLAKTFVMMSQLYHAKNLGRFKELRLKAIEEYKILSDLSPHEIWIFLELASNYRQLGEVRSEIETLEKVILLEPQNGEILYQLGQLYFKEGLTSKGFKTFEALKTIDLAKSDQLIAYYN